MTQRKLIFFHLPKTAGTSLRNELSRHFSADKVQVLYGRETFQSGIREFAAGDKLLCMGHFGWEEELAELLQHCLLVTFLREPVERVISHYLQFQRSHYPEHQVYRKMSFSQFLEQPMARNWQSRRLGGGFYQMEKSDAACFDEAAKNVGERFQMVGLTDEMTLSLQWLRELSGLDLQEPPHLNPRHHTALEPFRRWEAEISALNTFDTELYQMARHRLLAR